MRLCEGPFQGASTCEDGHVLPRTRHSSMMMMTTTMMMIILTFDNDELQCKRSPHDYRLKFGVYGVCTT